MGPLSGKQQREWAKHHAKEARESAKMESEEARKQQLHEIKLQETAAKANQGIGHKEEIHGLKVKELGGPLSGSKRINRQKLGLPSNNPLAGTEVFNRGQHMLPKGTDTVPAMLTPGEAVIPKAAAQDPKNKPIIKKMVQEGRTKHYANGTESVPNIAGNTYHTDSVATMANGTTQVEPRYYEVGDVDVAPYGFRYQNNDPIVAPIDYSLPMPKGNGYMGNVGSAEVPVTEYTLDDNKGQYPSVVPTLSRDEVATIATGGMTPEITNKAALYRDTREANGESPFADRIGLKVPVGAADDLYKQGQPSPVSVAELSAKPTVPVTQAVPVMQDDQYNPDVKQGEIPLKDDQYNPDVKQAVAVPFPVDDQYNADVKQWAKGGAATRSITPEALKVDEANAEVAKQLAGDKEFNAKIDAALAKNDKSLVSKIIEDVYGDTGIFNRKDLVRFALTAGGSMAMGYNANQALRFAGRDVLAHADKRNAQEAAYKQQEAMAIRSDNRMIAAEDRRYKREDDRYERTLKATEKREFAALAKEKRKELENDQDRYENFASKDVPAGIRQKALDMAYAPLKGETAEEQLEERRRNLRQATTLLANSTVYKDPNSGRHDRVAKFDWYEDSKGNTVYAAQDPYGSGKMIVRNNDGTTVQIGGEHLRKEGTTAKQGKYVAEVTSEYLKNAKDKDGKLLDTSAVGAKIMTAMQDHPGIGNNPYAVNAAVEQTVKALAETGKDYSATAVRHAFSGSMVKALTASQTDLFIAQGSKPGNPKPVSGTSLTEFGKAMEDVQGKKKVDLTRATEVYTDIWKNLPVAEKQKIANTTRDGYSPFQEFVIRDSKKIDK